jgi:hypothetical protein
MGTWKLSTIFVWNILSIREGSSEILNFHVNCLRFLSDFNEIKLRQILITFPILEFHENPYSGSQDFFFYADGRADGQTKRNVTASVCQV